MYKGLKVSGTQSFSEPGAVLFTWNFRWEAQTERSWSMKGTKGTNCAGPCVPKQEKKAARFLIPLGGETTECSRDKRPPPATLKPMALLMGVTPPAPTGHTTNTLWAFLTTGDSGPCGQGLAMLRRLPGEVRSLWYRPAGNQGLIRISHPDQLLGKAGTNGI